MPSKTVHDTKRRVLRRRVPSFIIPHWIFAPLFDKNDRLVLIAVYKWHAPPERVGLSKHMIGRLSLVTGAALDRSIRKLVDQGYILRSTVGGMRVYSPNPEMVYQPLDGDYYGIGGDLPSWKMAEQELKGFTTINAVFDTPQGKKLRYVLNKIIKWMPVEELVENAKREGVWTNMLDLAAKDLEKAKDAIDEDRYNALLEIFAANKYRSMKLGENIC